MIREEILELLLFHLLLVGDRLQHAVVVLGCAKIDEHRCIDRVVLHPLRAALVGLVCAAHRALLGTSDAGWNDQI